VTGQVTAFQTLDACHPPAERAGIARIFRDADGKDVLFVHIDESSLRRDPPSSEGAKLFDLAADGVTNYEVGRVT
jgi:hypothetical protein